MCFSILFCFDLFCHPGRAATFDGPTHLTTIAQFYTSLQASEFPARWSNNYATYGLPLPELSQQTTSYLGAFWLFITHQVELSYNLVVLCVTIGGALLTYRWLRLYTNEFSSLAGATLFIFSAYRIINVYIRGSIPEYAAIMFIPSLMTGLNYWLIKHQIRGLIEISISIALLLLTHPMIAVPASLIIATYLIYLIFMSHRQLLKSYLYAATAIAIGGIITAYYLIPLFGEIKYFYYGLETNHLRPSEFLSASHYFDWHWYYFKDGTHPGPRGNFNKFGLMETMILIYIIPLIIHRKKTGKSITLLIPIAAYSLLSVFLTLSPAKPLYDHISLLNGLQFPWRMFSGLIFVPPLTLALMLGNTRKPWLPIIVITCIVAVRSPQLYGKNYLEVPVSTYTTTQVNLHSEILDTIWMGTTRSYLPRSVPTTIIEGEGVVETVSYTNAARTYRVVAITPIRLVDYTFYFPGWHVFIDNQEQPIQFQDPQYRGMITYQVPAGTHVVTLQYKDTKIRYFGKLLSVTGIVCLIFWTAYLYKDLKNKKYG